MDRVGLEKTSSIGLACLALMTLSLVLGGSAAALRAAQPAVRVLGALYS